MESCKIGGKEICLGWSQFNKIFSYVVWLTTIKVVFAMYATFDLYLEQLDMKIMFLHEKLEEEIYMLQLEGFT